jgi:hypothetical protein
MKKFYYILLMQMIFHTTNIQTSDFDPSYQKIHDIYVETSPENIQHWIRLVQLHSNTRYCHDAQSQNHPPAEDKRNFCIESIEIGRSITTTDIRMHKTLQTISAHAQKLLQN